MPLVPLQKYLISMPSPHILSLRNNEKIKDIELNISKNIKSLIDINKLEEQILEI